MEKKRISDKGYTKLLTPKEKKKAYDFANRANKKEYDKFYRQENREKIKDYYQQYKERIKERRKEQITCECGSEIKKHNLTYHKKSQKHQKYLEELEENKK